MLQILSTVIHWLINSLWTQITNDSVFYCALLTQGFERGVSANGFSVNGSRALEFRTPDASGAMGEPLDYCIWAYSSGEPLCPTVITSSTAGLWDGKNGQAVHWWGISSICWWMVMKAKPLLWKWPGQPSLMGCQACRYPEQACSVCLAVTAINMSHRCKQGQEESTSIDHNA